jgi:hypothetical protein
MIGADVYTRYRKGNYGVDARMSVPLVSSYAKKRTSFAKNSEDYPKYVVYLISSGKIPYPFPDHGNDSTDPTGGANHADEADTGSTPSLPLALITRDTNPH